MVKRSKTPPFHGGNRGSIPLWVTTSRRAFWLAVFLYKNTASLYRLPLLFRKRSRSAHLLACKRARDDSLSLTTFRDFCACGAYISFWQVDPPRSKVRFAPTYFLSKISHPPTSLLLLFRKKALRVGYSLASALITPFAHYHLFASCAFGAYISFWQVDPPRSKVRFAPTYFLSKISHPPTSLLLLFRKKARSRRLFACKRTHNAFRSLSPFCELRLRRICIFFSCLIQIGTGFALFRFFMQA